MVLTRKYMSELRMLSCVKLTPTSISVILILLIRNSVVLTDLCVHRCLYSYGQLVIFDIANPLLNWGTF